ncbi:MAG TPA: pyrroline-5-carboxylate reductase [Anaerolineales bacterium]|nr:pyrroline-5-carboxylate reductase [Anaerolineales bacterium]
MLKKRIAFIGAGAMGEAVIAGALRKKLVRPSDLIASAPRAERLAELQRKYDIQTTTSNSAAVQRADVVVIAVKPQRLSEVMRGLKGIKSEALVISVVAGASLKKLTAGLKHKAVVRSMPNTPARIGEGIAVWTASHETSSAQRELARQILEALGEQVLVEDELYLDMATALSGNGPAYVFLFMEALIDAGVHMGFPRRIAEALVLQTVKGSADFYQRAGLHPAALRDQVTSPGGTSAEALYYLEKAGFRSAISRAVWAAYQRSLELGKEKPVHIPASNPDEPAG